MTTNTKNIIKMNEPLQQGDTFVLNFQYKENDISKSLPNGFDLIAALYDRKWNPLYSAKKSDGSLVSLGNGLYSMNVSHQDSMKMVGTVYLEVTITDGSDDFVDHAKQIVEYTFETRKNNDLL